MYPRPGCLTGSAQPSSQRELQIQGGGKTTKGPNPFTRFEPLKVLQSNLTGADPKTFGDASLGSFNHLTGFNAAGADIDFSDAAFFDNRTNPLQVGVKTSFVQVMCMGDIVAHHGFFTANSAFF